MSARRPRLLALVTVLAVLAGACSDEVNRAADVRDAIDTARADPYRFVYTERNPEHEYVVRGIVEDDFRYKAQLEVDGVLVLEEVAVDDALAVRVHDSAFLQDFVDLSVRGLVDTDTDVEGIDVLSALAAKRWVLDPYGAPSQTSPDRGVAKTGNDPVFDAFSVFAYVEQSIRESQGQVIEYSEESINPTYPRTEDVLSQPQDGSGVKRFDLRRPKLPTAADLTGQSNTGPPTTRHFRKLAVYVKDGRLVRVEERVEAIGSGYERLISYLREILQEIGGDAMIQMMESDPSFVSELGEDMPLAEQETYSDAVLLGLNATAEAFGGEPIRVRRMTLDLQDFGASDLVVELPRGNDVIVGDLAVLRSRGRKPVVDDTEA